MPSVVINGVEMPKDCESCLLSVRDPLGGFSRFCKVTKHKVAETKRADDCPLSDREAECEVCNKAMQVEIRKRVEHIRQAENTGWHYSKATEPCPYP